VGSTERPLCSDGPPVPTLSPALSRNHVRSRPAACGASSRPRGRGPSRRQGRLSVPRRFARAPSR